MAHAGQFGNHYMQVVDRLYHALEWRFNEVKESDGLKREAEIVAKLLDSLLADQVMHDLPLHNAEAALRSFQKVRHDSFTPGKYKEIMRLMAIDEEKTMGYTPHLFGHVTLETKHLT